MTRATRAQIRDLRERIVALESEAASARPVRLTRRDVATVYAGAFIVSGLAALVSLKLGDAKRELKSDINVWDPTIIGGLFLSVVAYLQLCDAILAVWARRGEPTRARAFVWAATWALTIIGSISVVVSELFA
jgi:hypothetical protein